MRISDWSSDVCSSDLIQHFLHLDCVVSGQLGFVQGLHDDVLNFGHQSGLLECRLDGGVVARRCNDLDHRSEEHTSELQSLMHISYAVFCLKKKKKNHTTDSSSTFIHSYYNP